MNLSEFKKILSQNSSSNIRFQLPTGTKIAPHAHVTEVARIDKKYVDCGGTQREESLCRLQAWTQDDTDHRLTARKLLAILEKATLILGTEPLEVDVEYEAPFISQFPIERATVAGEELLVNLGIKHTACLAEDHCLPPNLNRPSLGKALPTFKPGKCC